MQYRILTKNKKNWAWNCLSFAYKLHRTFEISFYNLSTLSIHSNIHTKITTKSIDSFCLPRRVVLVKTRNKPCIQPRWGGGNCGNAKLSCPCDMFLFLSSESRGVGVSNLKTPNSLASYKGHRIFILWCASEINLPQIICLMPISYSIFFLFFLFYLC